MKIIQNIFSTILIVFFFSGGPHPVFASQINIFDITVTPSEAPRVGDTVTVTVTASNPEGLPVYYKFYYCANYGTSAYAITPWTVVQDYSTSNTAQYTFNETGQYIIVVRAVTDPDNEPAALPIVGQTVTVTSSGSPSGGCGAYIAPGVWKEFDCYILAAHWRVLAVGQKRPGFKPVAQYQHC